MKSIKVSIILYAFLFIFSSCYNEKKIAYFQKAPDQTDTIALTQLYVPKIQKGDILSIYVSSLSPEASSFFNVYPNASNASGDASVTPAGGGANGFLVDASGNIELPLVGTLKLEGLTTIEAKDTIKELLKKYLKEPTVAVRFLNYKITVLGEVTRPSVYTIPNETITLPEALSMAGDLTIFARRDNIQIIRDNNGTKEFATINLNGRDIFTSPYYYLHANDIVYIQPGKKKSASTDRSYQLIPAAVSLISAIIILSR